MGNKKTDEHYVDSNLFLEQIKIYYETDEMTNELAIHLQNIAKGLSYNHRFINYTRTWKDEMVGDAVLKMYTALEKKLYNTESGFNPFSYFNTIAWNAFSNRIKKEKRQHDGLQEYKDYVYENEMAESSNGAVYVRPHLEHDENDGDYD